jgi:putative membrane protein insertion efficiency factor
MCEDGEFMVWLSRLGEMIVVGLVYAYRWTLRPVLLLLFGPCCRFQPSCSEYMVLAVRKYGVWRGVLKGSWRILRCHPWSPGGYDPP